MWASWIDLAAGEGAPILLTQQIAEKLLPRMRSDMCGHGAMHKNKDN